MGTPATVLAFAAATAIVAAAGGVAAQCPEAEAAQVCGGSLQMAGSSLLQVQRQTKKMPPPSPGWGDALDDDDGDGDGLQGSAAGDATRRTEVEEDDATARAARTPLGALGSLAPARPGQAHTRKRPAAPSLGQPQGTSHVLGSATGPPHHRRKSRQPAATASAHPADAHTQMPPVAPSSLGQLPGTSRMPGRTAGPAHRRVEKPQPATSAEVGPPAPPPGRGGTELLEQIASQSTRLATGLHSVGVSARRLVGRLAASVATRDGFSMFVICMVIMFMIFVICLGGVVLYAYAQQDDEEEPLQKAEKVRRPPARGSTEPIVQRTSQQTRQPTQTAAIGAMRKDDDAHRLCPELVVPDDNVCVLAVPSLKGGPPSSGAATFHVMDKVGTAMLEVSLARDVKAKDAGGYPSEQITLKSAKDGQTLARCTILLSEQPSMGMKPKCSLLRRDSQPFARLEAAGGASVGSQMLSAHSNTSLMSASYILTAHGGLWHLLFFGSIAEKSIHVTDEQQQLLGTVEPGEFAFERGGHFSLLRVAPKADAGLVLCCILALDRMT